MLCAAYSEGEKTAVCVGGYGGAERFAAEVAQQELENVRVEVDKGRRRGAGGALRVHCARKEYKAGGKCFFFQVWRSLRGRGGGGGVGRTFERGQRRLGEGERL